MNEAGKAHAYQDIERTEGWRLLAEFMSGRMEASKARLLTAKTWDEVVKHQAAHEALQSVFTHMKETIDKGMNEE